MIKLVDSPNTSAYLMQQPSTVSVTSGTTIEPIRDSEGTVDARSNNVAAFRCEQRSQLLVEINEVEQECNEVQIISE